ncbi:MAG TPA: carboxypeptidase-like regulatory domain-containing protein, partial [Hanamia sp.]|nr:carboxypeptidase-like regulatory domain-containing protein [Hanamia sp.]
MYFKANYHQRGLIEKLLLFITSNPVYRKISHRTNGKQILLAMKMTTILLFSVCLTASAGGIAQKVTLSQKNVKLEKVFREIRKQTGYVFFYDANVLQGAKSVSIHVKDASVEEALKETLQGQPLDFSIERKTVTIIQKTVITKQTVDIIPAVPFNIITGTVKDEKGDPLAGVSVILKGTNKGTSTDTDGHFTIDANAGDVLEFTFIGYQRRNVTVGQSNNISVVMEIEAAIGNEVVVVGYGTQRKQDITGAVSEVNLTGLKSRSYKDVGQSLQGNAPGVIVQDEGGDPTSGTRINIRGLGGVNAENPLFIVDGSIYNGGPLNPNDIESISVLKDASAAIYGARASGGVILVTTKKGKEGKLTLDINAKNGFQNAWRIPQALNAAEYASVSNLAADNAGVPRLPVFDASVYPDGQITRTNWMDAIFRTGKIQDYNVGLRGGSKQSTFYTSFDYRKDDGILLNTYSERYNFRINSDHHINDWLTIGEHLSLTYNDGQYGTNTTSGYQGAIISAIFYP